MKEVIRYAWGDSSLGAFLVASSERGLVFLGFGKQDGALLRDLESRFAEADTVEDVAALRETVRAVAALADHPEREANMPVDLRGSEFERRVWQALQQIPPGETVSYGELASRIGDPGRARDVGAACGANPISLIVPCHRVVKKDGSISGYRWGVRRKRELIARESRAEFHLT